MASGTLTYAGNSVSATLDARPLTFSEKVDNRVAQDASRAIAGQRLKELMDKNPEFTEMIGLVVDLGLFYN